MIRIDPIAVTADAVDELKTYVRLESDEEDALLMSLIASAASHGEAFTAQSFFQRGHVDRLSPSSAWQRLGATPVQAITLVTGLPATGAPFTLPVSAYALDIDGSGDGWIRITDPGLAKRVDVTFTAGIAPDWGELPETIRHGILRLATHLHAVRDASDDVGPPAIVAALWRPWRRMRLN
jgi:uncharacterized phiE125 gp8 family phage protein